MTEGDPDAPLSDDERAPPSAVHYAMHRVLGPAMGVVVFVVMLVVFPILIAGGAPPFSILQIAGFFALACLGFWIWARHVDKRGSDHES
ncbi:MAG: hypothetical protein AAFP97_04170 [Pseudomonadota bacterium]